MSHRHGSKPNRPPPITKLAKTYNGINYWPSIICRDEPAYFVPVYAMFYYELWTYATGSGNEWMQSIAGNTTLQLSRKAPRLWLEMQDGGKSSHSQIKWVEPEPFAKSSPIPLWLGQKYWNLMIILFAKLKKSNAHWTPSASPVYLRECQMSDIAVPKPKETKAWKSA